MDKFNTNGGYFAPQNYTRINEGGSHEENPNGGVQLGVDNNGIPNLLEENEPVYDDFVYSDNITADKDILKEYNLPEKFAGKLYSEIADYYVKAAEEQPNDHIANAGMDAMLKRLASAQEKQKQLEEQTDIENEINNLSPEEQQQLAQMLMQSQQNGEQQQMIQQETIPAKDMMNQTQTPVTGGTDIAQVMANGGYINTFEPGGEIVLSKQKPVVLSDPETGITKGDYIQGIMDENGNIISQETLEPAVAIAFPGKTQAWVDAEVGPRSIKKLVSSGIDRVGRNIFNGVKTAAEFVAPEVMFPAEFLANAAAGNTNELPLDILGTVAAGMRYAPVVSQSLGFASKTPSQKLINKTINKKAVSKATSKAARKEALADAKDAVEAATVNLEKAKAAKTTAEARAVAHINSGSSWAGSDPEFLGYDSVVDAFNTARKNLNKAKQIRAKEVLKQPAIGWTIGGLGVSAVGSGVGKAIQSHKRKSEEKQIFQNINNEKIDEPNWGFAEGGKLQTASRYAGVVNNGLAALSNALQKPDEYKVETFIPTLPTVEKPQYVNPVYIPMDSSVVENAILANNAASRRAIRNAGVGASTIPALLASQYTGNNALGSARIQTRKANNNQLNNIISTRNSNVQNLAQRLNTVNLQRANIMNNARKQNILNNMNIQQANYEAEGQKYAALSQNLNALSQALAGIGQENFAMNQLGSMPYNYKIKPDGSIEFSGTKKNGGKLNRKKIK